MLIFSMFEDDPDCFWIISQSVLHVSLYSCPWGSIPILVSLDPTHEPPFVEGTWLSLLRSCALAHGREERNASALVVLREPQFGHHSLLSLFKLLLLLSPQSALLLALHALQDDEQSEVKHIDEPDDPTNHPHQKFLCTPFYQVETE